MRVLRLILGDQLNHSHSWFDKKDDDITYLMAEMRQETDYVVHHIQKVVAFFSAMRNFADFLRSKGHRVIYYKISDSDNPQELEILLDTIIEKEDINRFEYQLPDEFRLDQQLKEYCANASISTNSMDTEHFMTSRDELAAYFKGKKQLLMESFYRMMRKKHNIMVENDQPEGGQWNFDKSNRKKWKGDPEIPHHRGFRKDVSQLVEELGELETLGELRADAFDWPVTREDALSVLNYFCKELLPHFGDYQDAMHTEEPYLFHSRLSFALNVKILSPKEVIEKVITTYRENKGKIHISQTEGFVRQILGWREYMRGIYWKEMPGYRRTNALRNQGKLPEFYWTGNTRMNCLKHAIKQSLTTAYAHHIQRLMITGNFALLLQVHPDEVDRWYLGIYIDAIEWVEMPNTRGMSQYADGGVVATKPYISSANYIHKMSNYCSGCYYSHTAKTGEKACPFNALYWNFLDEKKEILNDNQRMGMMYSLMEKKDPKELQELKARAREIIENPDSF